MKGYREIVALENQALSAQSEHQHEEAIAAHSQALKIAEGMDRPRLVAVLFNRLGVVLEAAGRIQQAVIAYESGLNALAGESPSDLEWVIDSLRGAVKGYDAGFAYLEVSDLYSEESAADLTEAEVDDTLAVKLLINIGNAYLRQPQVGPALNAYEQALQQAEILDAPTLHAHALTHIAIIRRRRGEIDQAEDALRKALALLDRHADPLEKRTALAALAGIYRERGEIDRALETYRQAVDLYQHSADHLGEARAQAGLGHIYLLRQQWDAAQVAFQRAVDLAQRVRDEDTLCHAYWGLGRCQHVAGELDAAAESFRRSLDKIKGRRRELRTDEGKVTFLESVQDIYDHLIAVHLDRARTVARAYADALQVAEEARGQALHDLMGVRRRRFQTRQTGTRDTRLRSFPDRLDVRQEAPGISSPPEAYSPVQMAPGVESAPAIDVSGLLDDAVWSEDTIGLSDMVETAAHIPSTVPRWPDEVDDIAAVEQETPAPPPLARLVFHVLAERTGVFAVTPEGEVHAHVVGLGRDALTQRVAAVRGALDVDEVPRGATVTRDVRRSAPADSQADVEPLLRALYAELVHPVADKLPADGTPVVIEPHGPLWLLPYAALLTPENTWLADKWPLLYAPSAQLLDEIRREPDYGGPKDLKPLMVGNPTMPTIPDRDGVAIKLQPLQGAEQEARAVFALFENTEGTLLLGEAADWASVVAQMPRHGIVHLATHGIAYSESPLDSLIALGVPDGATLEDLKTRADYAGWAQGQFLRDSVLADGQRGLLTARQIVYLPLPADLVTLSACQTGLGQISGDGMIGLSRSFLVAGARAVLVSQWSVSDEATAALMAAFYQGYIELDDKALALQRAMRELRTLPEYAHPRYWAPFVVVGAEA